MVEYLPTALRRSSQQKGRERRVKRPRGVPQRERKEVGKHKRKEEVIPGRTENDPRCINTFSVEI